MAICAVTFIFYMDLVECVSYPVGGMNALPNAMEAVARKAGVEFRYDTRVTATTWSGDRVTGLRSLDRRTWAPDAVVMTLDRPAGRSATHVLFPVPNLDHGHPLDWARLRGP